MKKYLSNEIIFSLCILQLSSVHNSKCNADHLHSGSIYKGTAQWAVQLMDHAAHNYEAIAKQIAHETGLVNRGRIGHLDGYYLLQSTRLESHERAHSQLEAHRDVYWFTRQVTRKRYLRHREYRTRKLMYVSGNGMTHSASGALRLYDPAFRYQWHLVNRREPGHDLNVVPVWQRNITGKGVTTVVVDDGLQWRNPDLRENYNPAGSWDFISDDDDPTPELHDSHGTRCAGEIAAVANRYCGVGVAYDASIAGIRLLGAQMTDALEATAFTKNMHVNDIYSCSWGPEDSGSVIDGPHHLSSTALRHGVTYGRRRYGAIYVVASGNGGLHGDNCNFDGYANSIYTITIGAVDENQRMPSYAEECASMLAVTYSSGSMRDIVTTDWLDESSSLGLTSLLGCTMGHSGTSAAAPLAAGIVALMLQARPCLSWRDVQHIIVMAAVKVDVDVAHWYQNSVGLHHSHKHGFGLMDAWRLVNAAKVWSAVPWLTSYTSPVIHSNTNIPVHPARLTSIFTVTAQRLEGYNLNSMEYVQVVVTMKHVRRGDVEIRLRCPSHMESVLAATRYLDNGTDGFNAWQFSTVRCWGESAMGMWMIIVTDKGNVVHSRGKLISWSLRLYGSSLTSEHIKQRMQLVENASNGQYLYDNFSLPCPPAPIATDENPPNISHKYLKMAAIVCIFLTISAVSESLEYLLCYNDEKRLHHRVLRLVSRMHQMTSRDEQLNESSRLLTNETSSTPLESVSSRKIPENSESLAAEFSGTEAETNVDSLSIQQVNNTNCGDSMVDESSRILCNETSKLSSTSDDMASLTCSKADVKTNDVAVEMNELCSDTARRKLSSMPLNELQLCETIPHSSRLPKRSGE